MSEKDNDNEFEVNAYDTLGIAKNDFRWMLRVVLMEGVTEEYVDKIVDRICDDVAVDVLESADVSEWNSSDISLGAGRVILKALGVDV